MADTADTAAFSSPADQAERPDGAAPSKEAEAAQPSKDAEETHDDGSLKDLFEQLGHELRDLGTAAGQLEAARDLPEVRRAARDAVGALVVVAAALTAFAFLNVAAVEGLSRVMATWLAALVLAGVWLVIGGVLFFGLIGRARRWLLWIVVKAPPPEAFEDLERQRDEAAAAARSTLERLGPALVTQIAMAAIPKAEDVAGEIAGGVAVGVVEVGDNVLDASDEIVDVVAEQLPGGSVVGQAWDVVVLRPGRLGVRVATTVLRRGRPAE